MLDDLDETEVLRLGDRLERVGDVEGAVRAWTRLLDSAEARLRLGRSEARRGNAEEAARQLRAGVELVRARPDRVAEPDQLTHDLLLTWSEVAYRRDAAVGDRLLGEAARAFPGSPGPLVLLAHRAKDGDAARRLMTVALARVDPGNMPEFLARESTAAVEVPKGDAILEVLLRNGLTSTAYEEALAAWSARHLPPV
jgi:hypothetical protein